MRTSKGLIALLISALAVVTTIAMEARQDSTEKTPPAATEKPSGTRIASAMVKLTVDPDIVVLNPDTVESLIHSPTVGRDATALLGLKATADIDDFLLVEWLSQDSERIDELPTQSSPPTRPQSPEEIYGASYMSELGFVPQWDNRKRGEPAQLKEQTALVKLTVSLPEDVTPAATEFLNLVVENLRTSLTDAYEKRKHEFANRLTFAESRLTDAEVRLERVMGGDSPGRTRVNEQLDRTVDLSGLTPEMPVREAVELLRNSVDPPLQIVVLWRDLEENAEIEPVSPIQMDGLADVKVRTALEALLEVLGAGTYELSYRVGDNVVTVGTTETLGMRGRLVFIPPVEVDLQALIAQRTELARKVQSLELELGGQEARRKAIAEQIARTEGEAHAKLAQDQVTKELENLVQFSEENLTKTRKLAGDDQGSLDDLAQATESLTRARIELAKRREELSKQAGGGQLEQLTGEMGRIAIDRAEKQAQLNIVHQQLEEVQRELAEASAFDPEAARMRIAREAFDIATRQVAEWQTRLATLQPSMVTVIGAN